MKLHGHADRPALATWLAPYVAQRWQITAFRIAFDGGAPIVTTAAVRMTFTRPRPFPVIWARGTKIPSPLDVLALLAFAGWRVARRRSQRAQAR